MKPTYGVLIARFQIDELHEGHRRLIEEVERMHEKVIILLGDKPTPVTATNPLSYEVRRQMVLAEYPFVEIYRLMDIKCNKKWSNRVDNLIGHDQNDVVLYSGRDGFIPWYTGKYKTVELDLGIESISATARRKEIGLTSVTNPLHSDANFRRGIIYAMQNLPHRTYTTVDMAIIRESKGQRFMRVPLELLLARKPDEELWRFPGGFVDKGEKFADAAARETIEETGLNVKKWYYLDDFMIPDWRVQGVEGVDHKTVLMVGQYDGGTAVAGDDINEVKWFKFSEITENMLVKLHRQLYHRLTGHLDRLGYLL